MRAVHHSRCEIVQGPFPAKLATPILGLLLIAASGYGTSGLHQHVQADWSFGPGTEGPVTEWDAGFAGCDVVSWSAIPGQIALASTPLGSPASRLLDLAAQGAIKVVAEDVDRDGATDILVAGYWDNTVTLLHNLGGSPPVFSPHVIATDAVHPVGLGTADVNGDRRPDIMATASEDGEVIWWQNLGGSPPRWTRRLVGTQVAGGHDIVGADLDGDGDTDLVVPACDDDELLWFRNEGGDPISWSRQLIVGAWDYPTKASIADLDDDGDLDVAASAWLAQEIAWFENNGGDPIVWTRHTLESGFTGSHWAKCADVDGDGATDVLGAAMDRGEIAWWRNPGGAGGSWPKHTITSSLAGAVSVEAADLDGDGDTDVAGAGWSAAGGVSWYENTSNGQTWVRHRASVGFGETSSVHIADVDRDGDLDLLASSWSRNRAQWWEITEYRARGTLTSSILDTGGTIEWQPWSLHLDEPDGTSAVVEARASDDPEHLDQWVEIDLADPARNLVNGVRYLQVRVTLNGGPEDGSPVLRRLSVRWSADRPSAPRRGGRR